MFESWALALGALFVSTAAVGLAYLNLKHSASKGYIDQLERRVAALEGQLEKALKDLETAIRDNAGLRDEKYVLLERLFKATGGRRDVPD